MAVKAQGQISLSLVVDIKAAYRYYLLQSSTLDKPAKPTSFPPAAVWKDTEPAYTDGSTSTLYTVDCTVFCDDTFSYSDVSVSSSYEAAKTAYNKAVNAQNTATSAKDTADQAKESVDNLEVGGRNLLLNSSFSIDFTDWTNNGAEIADKDGYTCAHITGELTKTKYVSQDILSKVSSDPIGQEYTFSADICCENYVAGSTNPFLALYFSGSYDNDGTSEWLGATTISSSSSIGAINDKGWARIKWVLAFWQKPTSLAAYLYARDFTGDVYFKNLKLEKGNKATDWTPAPEDQASSKDVENIEAAVQTNTQAISDLNLTTDEITASVTKIEETTKSSFESVSNDIEKLSTQVSAKMTSEEVKIEIQRELENGVTKVKTSTGFTFDDDGMTVEKAGSEMKTQITEDGMAVYKSGEKVLEANNVGVDAKNLHATTYLIVGKNSRFEDYGDSRTGCFWIGG